MSHCLRKNKKKLPKKNCTLINLETIQRAQTFTPPRIRTKARSPTEATTSRKISTRKTRVVSHASSLTAISPRFSGSFSFDRWFSTGQRAGISSSPRLNLDRAAYKEVELCRRGKWSLQPVFHRENFFFKLAFFRKHKFFHARVFFALNSKTRLFRRVKQKKISSRPTSGVDKEEPGVSRKSLVEKKKETHLRDKTFEIVVKVNTRSPTPPEIKNQIPRQLFNTCSSRKKGILKKKKILQQSPVGVAKFQRTHHLSSVFSFHIPEEKHAMTIEARISFRGRAMSLFFVRAVFLEAWESFGDTPDRVSERFFLRDFSTRNFCWSRGFGRGGRKVNLTIGF